MKNKQGSHEWHKLSQHPLPTLVNMIKTLSSPHIKLNCSGPPFCNVFCNFPGPRGSACHDNKTGMSKPPLNEIVGD